MRSATRRQRQILDWIRDFIIRNQYSPSFEEIAAGVGVSSLATVHKHISNLQEKGLLKRDYNCSRSITLAGNGCAWCDRFAEQIKLCLQYARANRTLPPIVMNVLQKDLDVYFAASSLSHLPDDGRVTA